VADGGWARRTSCGSCLISRLHAAPNSVRGLADRITGERLPGAILVIAALRLSTPCKARRPGVTGGRKNSDGGQGLFKAAACDIAQPTVMRSAMTPKSTQRSNPVRLLAAAVSPFDDADAPLAFGVPPLDATRPARLYSHLRSRLVVERLRTRTRLATANRRSTHPSDAE
jgi:hypothetical protein